MQINGTIEYCDLCCKAFFRKETKRSAGYSEYEDSNLESISVGPYFYRICKTCSSKIQGLIDQIQNNHSFNQIDIIIDKSEFEPIEQENDNEETN